MNRTAARLKTRQKEIPVNSSAFFKTDGTPPSE
jgi:hypothetical protein